MGIFVLDGKQMTDPVTAHEYIAAELGFPEFYGSNLDALYDCLTDLDGETSIILIDETKMRQQLGDYADRLLQVFDDAAAEEGAFSWLELF